MATYTGDDDDNIINGGADDDVILGKGGNDLLVGKAGRDTINGGDGNDRLFSHDQDFNFVDRSDWGVSYDIFAEQDFLYGGAGDDYIFAGYGDTIDGGARDILGNRLFISFRGATSGVQADFRLLASHGSLTIGGGTITNIQNIGYLEGSDFDDLLVPIDSAYPSGADVYGRGGNDHIIANYYTGWDHSVLDGGAGDDIIDASAAHYGPMLLGAAGNDMLIGGDGNEIMDGGDGDDRIYGNHGMDYLWGGDGNDLIDGGPGADEIGGADGNDTLYGAGDADIVDGGAGDDIIYGDSSPLGGANAVNPSSNDDVLCGGTGADVIYGEAGNDKLWSGDRAGSNPFGQDDLGLEKDRLFGGEGDDALAIGYGDDADGGTGTDTLNISLRGATSGVSLNTSGIIGAGPFSLLGGTIQNMEAVSRVVGSQFADTITIGTQDSGVIVDVDGAHGNDVIISMGSSVEGWGNAGDDRFISGSAADIWHGGPGIDTVVYSNATAGVTVSLAQGTGGGGDKLSTIEDVEGSAYSDTLIGNAQANVLSGFAGNDTLDGGAGSDTLDGGAGIDTLSGGAGNVTFRDTAAGLNGDTITDFAVADRIVISDASLAGFTFSLTGNTLTFTGGSLTLTNVPAGRMIVRAAPEGGVQISIAPPGAAARTADFNGDGRDDLIWRNGDGAVIQWLAQANGSFANNPAAHYEMPTNWQVHAIGDFNGDGRGDLIWRRDSGSTFEWLGQADGTFAYNAAAHYELPKSWNAAATGDFNGDGRDDLIWRNEVGSTIEWLGQADGTFAYNAAAHYELPKSWNVSATGDFNGDGRDDLIWRNEVGSTIEWLGQANGTFAYNAAAHYELPNSWDVAASGDFNGDGREDLIWRNEVGSTIEWLGQADGTFAYNAAAHYELPHSWHINAVGDFNGDGRDDLIWRSQSGSTFEWLGQSNGTFAYNSFAHYELPPQWHIQPDLL